MATFSREVVRSALRILASVNRGVPPNAQDLTTIKDAVPSTQPQLPPNVLAAYIVDRAAQGTKPVTEQGDRGAHLHAQTQATLIRLVSVDLDLAFTLLRTAQIGRRTDADGSTLALSRAGAALQQVRRFAGRVRDPIEAERIQARADELESELARMKGPLTARDSSSA